MYNSADLLGDHLGSSSVTTNASGVKTASALYKAFGETRYSSGALGTDYKFTGQREQAELGLYFYGARWYDGSLGRFTSPDTMIPSTQGTQAWDRYAYVNNNPVRYNDPTGHQECDYDCQEEYEYADPDYEHYGEGLSCWGAQDCLGNANLWEGGGTVSLGVGGSIFSPLFGLRGEVDVSVDGEGNVALQASGGGGEYLGFGIANIDPSLTVTDASNVNSLNGATAQFGASVLSEGLGFGIEKVYGSNRSYEGTSYNGGISYGFPVEGHASVTGTITIGQFNIFDAIIQFVATYG